MTEEPLLANESVLALRCYEHATKCVYNRDGLHECRYKRYRACTNTVAMVNRCTLEINRLTKQGEGNE